MSSQSRATDITITTLANLADHHAQVESLAGLNRVEPPAPFLEHNNSHFNLNAYRQAAAALENQMNLYPSDAQIAQTLLFQQQHAQQEGEENPPFNPQPQDAAPARTPAKRGRKPKNASAPSFREGELQAAVAKQPRGRAKKMAASSASPTEAGEDGIQAHGETGQGLTQGGENGSDQEDNQGLQDQEVHDPHEQEKMDPEDFERKRKESHKEVERRRRDNINHGIHELSKIVPECEKNKGSVLHKSVEYIKYLQKTNLLTIEKWREERKEAEERILLLSQQLEEYREENERLRKQLEPALKRRREEEEPGKAV